jgi:hypothetical protein
MMLYFMVLRIFNEVHISSTFGSWLVLLFAPMYHTNGACVDSAKMMWRMLLMHCLHVRALRTS